MTSGTDRLSFLALCAAKMVVGFWLVAIFLVRSGLAGQASSARQLTLQAALELAEKRNLDLVAARARRAVTEAGVRIAGQRPNPTFSFTALRDTPHEGFFIDQPLEIGGKRDRRLEVARQEGALTEVEITTVERHIRRSTREAYYRLAFARAESGRLAEVLKLTQRIQQIARERYEGGAVAQLEVVQAALEVSRAQADARVAEQEEKVVLSQMNALLNEPASTPWELGQALLDLPSMFSAADLIERAYTSSADLQHLAQELKLEQSRRGLIRAQRIPNLDLQYGLDFNAPRDFRVGPRSQIGLTLPIFNRSQGELAQSAANERLLEAEAEATKRAVSGRVETAYFALSAQQTRVEVYRQLLLPSARRLEGMAEDSYRAGKSNILAVIDAQRNVQAAERSYLEGLVALHDAFAGLEETVGAPLD